MINEGYIKFKCNWIRGKPISEEKINEMNQWRSKLYGLGLIGAYRDGTGFGNISVRLKNNQFIISGSQTGSTPLLTNNHYTIVTKSDIIKNKLTCKGSIIASSESLTHSALYLASKEINAVIHVHNLNLWKKLIYKIPTTKEVPYGTPEMANEIFRLFKETDIREKKILVMAGHKEGVISFGKDIEGAGNVLLQSFSP